MRKGAQYYPAASYQRKFYLQRAKRHFDDWDSLRQAAIEYRNYTDKFYREGRHEWLADAFFNLAMVYLQLGESSNAAYELQKMMKASERDGAVYIYQITWSSQSQDVVDADLPADRLADFALKSLHSGGDFDFEKTALLIQKWCQGQRIRVTAR